MMKLGRAKSSNLFLLELIIAILFFSIASAVCVQLFVKSHLLSVETSQLNQAVNLASGAAESVMDDAVADGESSENCDYYDETWKPCDETGAAYSVTVCLSRKDFQITGNVVVQRTEDAKTLYELPITHHVGRRAGDE
ncbi:type IV pilus modification PilV family protein [Hespellia stercorisuis]|uniref:Prepilin-type N-terminal cleavage/methylation domain-containing protein n=1 Tax=Hespellia stercorisuis DSM 15480 TaxID=1121950 RepID=A0A1M6SK89_9FIRM|nr:hypothetical protein [Hespellia stercorisuis]SHK45070.1 hypothetical protein SAMN02745243_02966 [Hespellia stercorisuis DSM 15480]